MLPVACDSTIANRLFQPNLNQLQGPEGPVHLEPRTSAVLADLVAHAGDVRTREELLETVWGDAFVGEAVLTHCIWELRRAFADDARNPTVIQTVPRRGYRLIATVREARTHTLETMLLVRFEGFAETLDRPLPEALATRLTELAGEHLGRPETGELSTVLFARPVDAVRFAMALHGEIDGKARARVSIHLDEFEALDLTPEAPDTGDDGNPGRRLVQLALPGQTLLTRAAFDLARRAESISAPSDRPRQELRWLAHGPYLLQGQDEAIEIFEVGVEGLAPLVPPNGDGAKRAESADDTILGWRPAPGLSVPGRPHWELVEKLGEGGFGEVWLAHHQKTGDRRAFKFCFEAERLRALQREVTLFRLLKNTLGQRPDIVHLLDWNFDSAPYFIETEHTAAGSLVEWAEAQGGFGEVPLAQRLELVAQTAEALAAAHSVGVLHKDIKPANLLVYLEPDQRPRVRICDFGIGHILERERLRAAGITHGGFTETKQSSSGGTSLYMAPEVLEGRIASTAADVYALGVLLYQATLGELDRAVATGWRRNVSDEILESDIAACVDLAPEQRPSARELAKRLRDLEERRQQKEKEEREWEELIAGQQALEQARRRRRFWVAAAGLATATAVLVSLFAWQAVEARETADRNRSRAETLVSFLLGDLRQTLASVGRLDAMDGAIDQVFSYYESFDARRLSDQDLANRAEALRQLGDVRLQQGRLEDAQSHFLDAAELAQQLTRRDPQRQDWRASYADSRFWLGFVLERRGDFEGAEAAYRLHLDTYEDLVREQPDHKHRRRETASGLHNLGQLAIRRGDLDQALRLHHQGQALLLALAAEYPDDAELTLAVATKHNRIGAIELQLGELRSALEEFRTDLALLTELLAASPDDTRLRERRATAMAYTGTVLWMLGRTDEAMESFRAQVQMRQKLAALDPENVRWRRYHAVALGLLGNAVIGTGEPESGLALVTEARNELETLLSEGYQSVRAEKELAVVLRFEAKAFLRQGRPSLATAAARRSVALLESLRTRSPDDPVIASRLSLSYSLLAEALRGLDPAAVAEAREKALERIEQAAASSRDPDLLDPWARALLALGRAEEARIVIERLRAGGYREPELVRASREAGL